MSTAYQHNAKIADFLRRLDLALYDIEPVVAFADKRGPGMLETIRGLRNEIQSVREEATLLFAATQQKGTQ